MDAGRTPSAATVPKDGYALIINGVASFGQIKGGFLMQLDSNIFDVSLNLLESIPEMMKKYNKQIGEETIREYQELEEKYKELKNELGNDLNFATNEKVDDLVLYQGLKFEVAMILCYLKGQSNGRRQQKNIDKKRGEGNLRRALPSKKII